MSGGPDYPGDLPLGVLTVDTGLIVRSWSRWLESASGIRAADAVGRPLAEVAPDAAARGLLAHFSQVVETGEPHVLASAFHRYLIPCPPSAPSPHFTRMQQMVTLGALREGESIVGVMATIEDVTARLDAERTLAAELRSDDPAIRQRASERLRMAATLHEPGAIIEVFGADNWQVRRTAVEGLSRHASPELIVSLVEALRHQHRDFNVLASALQLLSRIDVDLTAPLAELLRSPDADLRIQAALALGERPGAPAGAALVEALADENANVRFHAVEALGRIRWSEAVEPLVDLVESGDFFLAFPALDALARIGDARVAPRLVTLLDDDALAAPAAEALGRIAGGEVVGPIVAVLDRPSPPVAAIASAVHALHDRYERLYGGGEFIEEEFKAAMTPARAQPILEELRGARLADLRALILLLSWLPGAEVDDALASLLHRPEVRDAALEALVRRGGPTAAHALVSQLESDDEDVQLAALAGLGQLGDRGTAQAVAGMLARGRALSVAAAGALARIGTSDVIDPLFALLTDPDAAIRQAAVGALHSLGHPDMPRRIAALLAGDDVRGRESAVRIAGYFGYDDSVERVVACVTDADEAVRRAAIEQVPHLAGDRALALLEHALATDAPRVRAAAAGALADVDGAGPVLVRALADADIWVRYFAARALVALRYQPAVPALAELAARDPAPHVRIAAIEAMGAAAPEEAAVRLEPFIHGPDGAVAAAAIATLGEPGDTRALPLLEEALRGGDPAAREAAVQALSRRGDEDAARHLRWAAAIEGDGALTANIVRALGRIAGSSAGGWPEAVDALVELAADQVLGDLALRMLAALPKDRVDRIAMGLSHVQESVRVRTIDALMRAKSPRGSAHVRDALAHTDPRVRLAAVVALDRVGAAGMAQTFARVAAQDDSAEVRRAAAAAVERAVGR